MTDVYPGTQNSGYPGRIMTGMGHEGSFSGTRNILFLGGNYTTIFTIQKCIELHT